MVKHEMMEKNDILKVYDITKSKLQYHITKKKDEFPKGKVNKHTRLKEYRADEIAAYARKHNWDKRPLSLKDVATHVEPGLNAMFGVAAQEQEQEQKEADDALVRAFNKRMVELDEELRQNKKTIMVMGGIIIALLVGYVAVL